MPAIPSRLFPNGTALAPSVACLADQDTGVYWDSANRIVVSVGGVACLDISLGIISGLNAGSASVYQYRARSSHASGLSGIGAQDLSAVDKTIFGFGNASALAVFAGKPFIWRAASNPFVFIENATEQARFAAVSGNFLVGTSTDSSNGRIQLVPHTTIAGGIGFGTDAAMYRNGAGQITIDGGVTIKSTSVINGVRTAVATLDFPSVPANVGTQDLTVTVTGAAVGDVVHLGLPAAPDVGLVWNAWVSAANTVTIRATNISAGAIDPASASYRVTVMSH